MRTLMLAAALAVAPVAMPAAAAEPAPAPAREVPPVLQFTMTSLSGEPVELSRYEGKVLLIVNVASKCGYTPQYAGLQALHEAYGAKGLAVLGFPANDFGAQEPGSDEDIQQFCSKNFGVGFDMFSKITVVGDAKTPLYQWLTSEKSNPSFAGEVKWNFEKFLVGRDGKLVGRFRSAVKPDDPELVKAIETALAGN